MDEYSGSVVNERVASAAELPAPRIERRGRLPSIIWIVPIAATLVGLSLLVNAWRSAGPRITISFQTAQGLEVGKTPVKYRNVVVGLVTGIALSPDHTRVLITADLQSSAKAVTMSDTRFWVVRPRIELGSISGLDTLLSGAYISLESGTSKVPQRHFVGLESPPPLPHGPNGKLVVLEAQEVGSVNLGAPVYFRRFQVGRVIDEEMDPNGTGVHVDVFIDAPYDRFVTRASRFWNASGIDLALDGAGFRLQTQSLASVLGGGIAFAAAPGLTDERPAPPGARFALFANEREALAPPLGPPRYVQMRFTQSLRGLAIGAPVEFIGVDIGQVTSIDLDYDAQQRSFPVVVTAALYPERMGKAYQALRQNGTAEHDDRVVRLVGELVSRGLRAQARPRNLLMGQLYIALEFMPGAAHAAFNAEAVPLEIPTVPGNIDQLQLRLVSILAKIDALPLNDMAHHADQSVQELHTTLTHLDEGVLPAAESTLSSARDALGALDRTVDENSPLTERLRSVSSEAERTLRSVRSLTDYLGRHPEAILRGRRGADGTVDGRGGEQGADGGSLERKP